jgi:hypothetical protein
MTVSAKKEPPMGCRNKDEIIAYVEQGWAKKITDPLKVLSAKVEQTLNEFGEEVHIWNVKTDKGPWWVVEGKRMPMNLYTQDAMYLGADEVYSFHLGLMARVLDNHHREPETVLAPVSHGDSRFLGVRRKLEEAAKMLVNGEEPEHFQAVGLACREALVALGQELVVDDDLSDGMKAPKMGDFKERAHLAIDRLLDGPANKELRRHARHICDAAWEFCNATTHSSTRTAPDAGICLSIVGAVQSLFENLIEKAEGPSGDTGCPICQSRRLEIREETNDESGLILKVLCAHCGWEDYIHSTKDMPVAD